MALALKIRFHYLLIRIPSPGRKLMHVEEKPIKQKTAMLVQICYRVCKLHKNLYLKVLPVMKTNSSRHVTSDYNFVLRDEELWIY